MPIMVYIIDINECVEMDDICGEVAECVNAVGSYECNCIEGYEAAPNGTCVGKCIVFQTEVVTVDFK